MTDASRREDDQPSPALEERDGGPQADDTVADAAAGSGVPEGDPPTGAAGTGGAADGDDVASDGDKDGDPDGDGLDIEALAASDPRSKAELLGALVQTEGERDEYLDDLRRSHADFENYRKRVMRESASQRDAGKAQVAEALLETLDDLDRTLEAAQGSQDASLAKGVELVAGKLVHALQGVGMQRIDATGVPFDPEVHEAVQQQPADESGDGPAAGPVVSQVLRPGYALGDRTLRAAMVVVTQ